MPKLFILLAILCARIPATGQTLPSDKAPMTFMTPQAYESRAAEIASHYADGEKKGWSWLARWINDMERNLSPDGKPFPQRIRWAGLEEYEAQVKSAANAFSGRQQSWLPAGPLNAPEPVDSLLVPGTGRINCIAFHPADPNIMWCGGGQGGIFKSMNGGQNWFPVGDQLPVMHVSDIAIDPNHPDVLYACLGDFAYVGTGLYLDDRKRHSHFGIGIYKSLDGGFNWTPTGLSFEFDQEDETLMRRVFVDPGNSNILLAAGVSGIYRSKDAGNTWSMVVDEVIWDIEQSFNQPEVIYASTGFIATRDIGHAGMLKSVDFGKTWDALPISVPPRDSVTRIEIGLSRSDENIIYALTSNLFGGFAGLHRSTDGGGTWEVRSTSPNILHWTSGTFSRGGQGWYDLAILVDAVDSEKVSIGGINSWVSEDGGFSWNGASYYHGSLGGVAVHADHHQLKYNPLDSFIYLCHDGGISRTQKILPGDWGQAFTDPDYLWPTEWEHLNNGLANLSFYRLGVNGVSPGEVFAGAQDMGTFYREAEDWTYHTLGDGMECIIHPANDSILYGSSQYGSLYKSTDRGQSFSSLGGSPRPWQAENCGWTTPFALLPGRPETILVGAENIWVSPDNGEHFSRISNFENRAPISSFSVCEMQPEHLILAKRLYWSWGQKSEMYITHDFGQTWENVTAGLPDSLYFSSVEMDDDDPLHAWVTCSGFSKGRKVYETNDGGETWTNISGSLPNLPANSILHQPGSASNILYAAMDRGVYYKNDLMDDWEWMGAGLPNVVISEIEFLPHGVSGIPELYIATFGRGIWKTDALFDETVGTNVNSGPAVDVFVAPSPNNGRFALSVHDANDQGTFIINIVNVHGQTIHKELIQVEAEKDQVMLDLDIPGGLYYAHIRAGASSRTIPFLVIH